MNEQPAPSPTQLPESSKEGEAEAREMRNHSQWPSCPPGNRRPNSKAHIHCSSLTWGWAPPCPPMSPAAAQNALSKRLPFSHSSSGKYQPRPPGTLFPAEFCAYPLFTQAGTPQSSTQSSYFPWLLAPGKGSVKVHGSNEQASLACFSPSVFPGNTQAVPPSAPVCNLIS